MQPVRQNRYPSSASPYALPAALILLGVVLLLALFQSRTPEPLGQEAPPEHFSAGRAYAILEDLMGEGLPHPVDSRENEQVMLAVIAHLEALGYPVEIQDTMSCNKLFPAQITCARVRNLVARLPGEVDGPALMLAAHYDTVGASSGAADDMSGIAILLEAARILQDEGPHRNPILFLFTDGEEAALLGAKAFVQEHPLASNVSVALNLEARGTGGRSLMFETSDDNAWLIDVYARSVRSPLTSSIFYEIYRLMSNDTDFSVYKDAGMAGMNFAFIQNGVYYHTPGDSLANLDHSSVQHQGESVLSIARSLASMDIQSSPAGNAAYIDLLGLVVIHWSSGWNIPLAVLALLVLVLIAGAQILRGLMSPGSVLLGILVAFVTLISAVLLSLGVTWLVNLLHPYGIPWHAYPLPVRTAVWAAVLLAGGLVAILFSRKAGLWGLGLGAWLLWSLVSLLLAVLLPGAAVVLLLPVLTAVLLLAVGVFGGRWLASAAFTAAALAAAVIAFPMALLIEHGVGFGLSPAIVLWLAFVVSVLAPLYAQPEKKKRVSYLVTAGAGAVLILAMAAAALVPAYTPARPQPLSLVYGLDHDLGTAYWAAGPGTDLPQPLESAALFDRFELVHPLSYNAHRAAEAPRLDLLAPDWEVLSDKGSPEGRFVTVRLHSPRDAFQIELAAPVDNLSSMRIAGQEFEINPERSNSGYYLLRCLGHSCQGLEVTLSFGSGEPGEIFLIDQSFGLPPQGEALSRARDEGIAVPIQDGDVTLVIRRVQP